MHSIYSQSVHAPTLNAGLMDNDAEWYCSDTGIYKSSLELQVKPCYVIIFISMVQYVSLFIKMYTENAANL